MKDFKFSGMDIYAIGIDISTLPDKLTELENKWKAKLVEQTTENLYRFYRQNQAELLDDLYDLWELTKAIEIIDKLNDGGETHV